MDMKSSEIFELATNSFVSERLHISGGYMTRTLRRILGFGRGCDRWIELAWDRDQRRTVLKLGVL